MRRNIPSIVVGAGLVLLLALYSITYQVRFTDIAIKTTFGKPSDSGAGGESQAGLRFKWPWPIQGVVKYDKRIKILDSPEEQAQTKDRRILILTVFCGWRIENGVTFLQKVEAVREAEDRLRRHLRSEIGAAVGQHNFSDFVSIRPEEMKLPDIEQEIKAGMTARAVPYGIKIEMLGIRRIVLPKTTTEKVFAQMRAQREAMAEKTRSEGKATAQKMKSEAESLSAQILAFAARKADEIRAEGAAAAAAEYETFTADQDFANFLRELEFLEEALKTRTIFFLDSDVPGVRMLKEDRPILGAEPRIKVPGQPGPPGEKLAEEKKKKANSSKRLRDAVLAEPKK